MRRLLVAPTWLLVLILVSTVGWAGTASIAPAFTTTTCGQPVCTWTPFGPSTYIRGTGAPVTVTSTFAILNPNSQYTLHIVSDGVASALIWVNGTQVVSPSDFNPNVTTLDRAVTLQPSNQIAVQLRSKPGSSLTVSIIGVDNDAPTITDSESPQPNGFGWNNAPVTVSFFCGDATSGVGFCTPPLTVSTEGLGQTATGVARDLTGNTATLSQPVNIDLTPPSITASPSPAPNAAGWNNTDVTVSFNCSDALSGVQTCASPVALTTEGAGQQVSGSGTDYAGNGSSASLTLSIDKTPPTLSILSPTNGSTVSTSSLAITGNVSDALSGVASVSCNGNAATISAGSFSCSLTLAAGANQVMVLAADVAGNQASTTLSITLSQGQSLSPPPTVIVITPDTMTMAVGETRQVQLVDDFGRIVPGATSSVSDATVVQISGDPATLVAAAPGQVILTANYQGLTAQAQIMVLRGPDLPLGTIRWSVQPIPDPPFYNFGVGQIVQTQPTPNNTPDLYDTEGSDGSDIVRAFTNDGRQLWAVQLGSITPSAAAASSSTRVVSEGTAAPAEPGSAQAEEEALAVLVQVAK